MYLELKFLQSGRAAALRRAQPLPQRPAPACGGLKAAGAELGLRPGPNDTSHRHFQLDKAPAPSQRETLVPLRAAAGERRVLLPVGPRQAAKGLWCEATSVLGLAAGLKWEGGGDPPASHPGGCGVWDSLSSPGSHGSGGGRCCCAAARAAPGNASRCLQHLVNRLRAGLRFLHFLPAPASRETKSPKPRAEVSF